MRNGPSVQLAHNSQQSSKTRSASFTHQSLLFNYDPLYIASSFTSLSNRCEIHHAKDRVRVIQSSFQSEISNALPSSLKAPILILTILNLLF